LLFEDRWQQLARLYDNIPKKWTEKPGHKFCMRQDMAVSGGKWLDGEEGFATIDCSIADVSSSGIRDKNRGDQGSLAARTKNQNLKLFRKRRSTVIIRSLAEHRKE
jgi:hypothetical protein